MTPWERYFMVGRRAGCPKDQMQRFERADVVLQERQLVASAVARLCDRPDGPTAIGYGGARGGGKSHWLLAQMGVDDCQRVPGLKCLLLRKVGKANLEHFEDLRRKLFGELPHEFSAFRGILTFPNESRIIAGHFQNEKDIDAYLGLEYDVIGIEEATTLTIRRPTSTWAGLRSFVPDGELVIGFDDAVPGFFWLAGQGGYGIQSAAGASELAAGLLSGEPMSEPLRAQGVQPQLLSPARRSLAR